MIPTEPRTKSILWLLALVVHLGLAAGHVLWPAAADAAWHGFPLDDAWIHMVYGRNLAAHGAPFYNDTAEAGFSSPLWLLVLALAHLAASLTACSPVLFAKAFGVLAATWTSVGTGLLLSRLGARRATAVLATLLCASDPVLAFAQVSGMEVAVTTLAVVQALLAVVDGRHWRAGSWAALAYLGRPECVLLVGVLALLPWAAAERSRQQRLLSSVAIVVPPLLAALAWAAYCVFATGHPLPNTFYAKFRLAGDVPVWPVLLAVWQRLPSNWLWLGALLALLSPWAVRPGRRVVAVVLLLFPLLFTFAIAATRPFPASAVDYFFFARYPAPAWPLFAAAVALGVERAVRAVAAFATRSPRLQRLAPLTALLLVAALLWRQPSRLAAGAERYAKNCQNIDEVQVAFGRWVAAEVPAGSAVAVNDAGAIRYFGDRETVDLVGLNDVRVLFAEPRLAQVVDGPDALADWLLRHRVDSLVVFPTWLGALARQPRFAARFVEQRRLQSADYTIADPRSGQAVMVAYRVLPAAAPRPGR